MLRALALQKDFFPHTEDADAGSSGSKGSLTPGVRWHIYAESFSEVLLVVPLQIIKSEIFLRNVTVWILFTLLGFPQTLMVMDQYQDFNSECCQHSKIDTSQRTNLVLGFQVSIINNASSGHNKQDL